MMSSPVLSNKEITTQKIINLLEKLTITYQDSKEERQELRSHFDSEDEHFSLLEEIELLTVNLRGYGNQIKASRLIENPSQSLENLQNLKIFNIPIVAQFYFDPEKRYEKIKDYLRNLDYLRLLLLEYLHEQ